MFYFVYYMFCFFMGAFVLKECIIVMGAIQPEFMVSLMKMIRPVSIYSVLFLVISMIIFGILCDYLSRYLVSLFQKVVGIEIVDSKELNKKLVYIKEQFIPEIADDEDELYEMMDQLYVCVPRLSYIAFRMLRDLPRTFIVILIADFIVRLVFIPATFTFTYLLLNVLGMMLCIILTFFFSLVLRKATIECIYEFAKLRQANSN